MGDGSASERGPMGSELSYTAYVAARWPVLVRSAVLLGCRLPEAEDLAQTTLMRCYRSWDKVAAADDVDAYVYRVLVNALASSRRRRWWGEHPAAEPGRDEASTDQTPEDTVTTRDSLQDALATLPAAQQEVLVLRYYADLSEQQVSAVLGVPLGTVKSRASRALAQLSRDPNLFPAYGEPSSSRGEP